MTPVRSRVIVAAACALAASGLCVSAAPPDPRGGTGGAPLAGTLSVRVVLGGATTPIAGAFVMAGPGSGIPFSGNVAFTDGAGAASFAHAALTGTIAVTAGAAGHAYTTILDLGVSEVVLPLDAAAAPVTARIGDGFSGIEVNNGFLCFGDGNLDFGMALPALSAQEALGGGALSGLSTTLEPFTTPQGPVPVFSNLYAPAQCEALSNFEKLSWHLRVPTGPLTLFGLTMRVPLSDLLAAQSFLDLLRASTFREMDILRDVVVTGDSAAFDLNADLPLTSNLTLQITNGLPATDVIAAALGRITDAGGEELLMTTGLDGFDPDVDGHAATLALETRAAVGELSDLVHGALVSQIGDAPPAGPGGSSSALRRSGFTPPATLAFGSFFDIVTLDSADDLTFDWSDPTLPASPAADLNVSRVDHVVRATNPDDPNDTVLNETTLWTLYSRGGDLSLTLPALPPSAPVAIPDPDATAEADRLDFEHSVRRLGDLPGAFSYDAFAFSDIVRFGTHTSSNERPLRCETEEIAGLTVVLGANPGEVTLTWEASEHPCLETRTGRPYEVYAAGTARPVAPPGAWPSDPPFAPITDQDTDGSLADATFTHVPPAGMIFYVVVDRAVSGAEGPSGHYGPP